MEKPGASSDPLSSTQASRIYLLPNLMTAGNLFCGFVAIIRCIQARFASMIGEGAPDDLYREAVWFILAAVVFDSLDGRLARLGGRESLFGRDFDSIADVVSFGVAPARMVFFLILSPDLLPIFRPIGWFIGFIYLLCAGVRLARFNVITHPAVYSRHDSHATNDFIGLPVPAAAGMITSLVLLLTERDLQRWAVGLPVLMLLIAYLMVSTVRYPSFKEIDWHTKARFRTFIVLLVGVALVYLFRVYALVLLFLAYVFFGLIRHVIQLRRRRRRLHQLKTDRSEPVKRSPKGPE